MDIPGARREIARWLHDTIESLGLNPLLVAAVIMLVWAYLIYRKMDSWKEAERSERRWVILGVIGGAVILAAFFAQWITG